MNTIIREYCVKKLAQILHDCVECPGNRAEIDWATAQRYIDEHSYIVDHVADRLVSAIVADKARGLSMGDTVTIELKCDYDKFDQLFGRYIWEVCYQMIQRTLPRPPYQRIFFH